LPRLVRKTKRLFVKTSKRSRDFSDVERKCFDFSGFRDFAGARGSASRRRPTGPKENRRVRQTRIAAVKTVGKNRKKANALKRKRCKTSKTALKPS
jgi:hypothetical protein